MCHVQYFFERSYESFGWFYHMFMLSLVKYYKIIPHPGNIGNYIK